MSLRNVAWCVILLLAIGCAPPEGDGGGSSGSGGDDANTTSVQTVDEFQLVSIPAAKPA
jgi:hypothetical protein